MTQLDPAAASRSAPARPGVVILPNAAARRVSNQIARAYRGTYGAMTGLRTIVRSIAIELLASGASPEGVSQAFDDCVLNHPARLDHDPRNVVTGGSRSTAIIAAVRDCVATAASERQARR
jgi:hypothetical protein